MKVDFPHPDGPMIAVAFRSGRIGPLTSCPFLLLRNDRHCATHGLKNGVALQLGIEPARVHVVSPFVGGAFGSKGSVTPRTALVAIAARRVGRPVKLVTTRDQAFTVASYRAETRHHLVLERPAPES